MGIQRADDSARHLDGIWHGPSWRWWFDWNFTQWRVFIGLWLITTPVLIFTPGLMLAGLVGSVWYALPRLTRNAVALDRLPLVTAHNRKWWVFGVFLALPLLLSMVLVANPVRFWLWPAPWYILPFISMFFCGRFAKALPRWVDNNRPVAYHRQTVHKEIAGPRPRREPASFEEPLPELLLAADGGPSYLHDIHYALLHIDPKEIEMALFTTRPVTVEAVQWLPDDPMEAGMTLMALRKYRVTINFTDNDETHLYAPGVEEPYTLEPGQWIVFRAEGTMLLMTPKDIETNFIPAPPGTELGAPTPRGGAIKYGGNGKPGRDNVRVDR